MKKAIVLGGTVPHIALIERLKMRGYYTVLVDYLSNPPAKEYADEHIQESTLDPRIVLEIARNIETDLVISACIDQANAIACYVAERLNLPHPYSYDTALDVTQKHRMKSIMEQAGIPTSDFIVLDSDSTISKLPISYPVVVKPVDCNSSKGVHRADSLMEVNNYIKRAFSLSRERKVIVEKFVSGKEVQIDCCVADNQTKVIMTREKIKHDVDSNEVLQSSGSLVPAQISIEAVKGIKEIAIKIANAFKLRNTPFFIQAIVDGSNISVLEFAPRIGGGLSYRLIEQATGFDILNAVIDSFEGKTIRLCYNKPDTYYATHLIYIEPSIFGRFSGVDAAKEKGLIEEFYYLKASGTEIGKELVSGNRVGAYILKGSSIEEIIEKKQDANSIIKVLDIDGNVVNFKMMNRN